MFIFLIVKFSNSFMMKKWKFCNKMTNVSVEFTRKSLMNHCPYAPRKYSLQNAFHFCG